MRAMRTIHSLVGASALAAAVVAVPTPAHAALVISVPCNETALVNAIDLANTSGGGMLALAPFCTYTLTSAHGQGSGPSGLPVITTPITMSGFITDITRAPGDPYRIVEVDGPGLSFDGRLTLSNVTLRGGNSAAGTGGGIANIGGGKVSLVSSTVRGNSAGLGGGIFNDGSLTLNSSVVTGNTASLGGGIFKNAGSSLVMAGSAVVGNTPDNCADVGGPTVC